MATIFCYGRLSVLTYCWLWSTSAVAHSRSYEFFSSSRADFQCSGYDHYFCCGRCITFLHTFVVVAAISGHGSLSVLVKNVITCLVLSR